MTRRNAVAVLTLAPLASAQSGESKVRNQFVGVWKLRSCEATHKTTGEIRFPYGVKPVGRIIYDAAGRMSAQVMDPTRQLVGGPETTGLAAAARESSCEQVRAILAGYIAYFGRFEVDEPSCSVIHHVEASLVPTWVGADLRRTYEFAGSSQLILTASFPQESTRLVWERDLE